MSNDFFTVGIGASAGGEAALYDFFANISKNVNAAFIVVRHLKRDFQSQMKFLLSRHTALPIFTIRNGEEVRPHNIYLMPENTLASLTDGYLILRERPAEETINFAIDDFFISLGEDAKEKSVGIILSGMGSDGVNGANVIEEYGGIVMVQDPKSAKYDSMPSHVIQEDYPDYILPPKEMGRHLLDYIQSKEKMEFSSKKHP